MAKKPDLDDWCDELTAQLGRFHNWWRAQHVNDPEGFPYTLAPGEWDAQFTAWQTSVDKGCIRRAYK